MTDFRSCRKESQAVVLAWVSMMTYYRELLPLEQLTQQVAEMLGSPLEDPSLKPAHAEETRRTTLVRQFKERATHQFDQDLRKLVAIALTMFGPSQKQLGDLQHAVWEVHQLLDHCSTAWALMLLARVKELVVCRPLMLLTSPVKLTKGPPGLHERVFIEAVAGLLAVEPLREDGDY